MVLFSFNSDNERRNMVNAIIINKTQYQRRIIHGNEYKGYFVCSCLLATFCMQSELGYHAMPVI
jgi:hypothetical protein